MVRYSGPLFARSNIGDARKMIHEGKVLELECLMLDKNHPGVILNDEKLDDTRSDYLVAFETAFFPLVVVHLSM